MGLSNVSLVEVLGHWQIPKSTVCGYCFCLLKILIIHLANDIGFQMWWDKEIVDPTYFDLILQKKNKVFTFFNPLVAKTPFKLRFDPPIQTALRIA